VAGRRRFLVPAIVFFAVWLPASIIHAIRFGRRVRLSGPDETGITPMIDAWTFTGPAWAGVAFFVAVAVFVLQEWWKGRGQRGAA
jgi:hypothetical protein